MAGLAAGLVDAMQSAIGPWIHRAVISRCGPELSASVEARTQVAAAEATADLTGQLATLLALDIDQQWTNPLSIIRSGVHHANAVLVAAGVPPTDRDSSARGLHPEDVYDLGPASFADLSPAVHEAGLAWGAAKAYVHLHRRKSEEPV